MTDEVEGQVQTLEGFKVYAHGVGTVTPPSPNSLVMEVPGSVEIPIDFNESEGEE